MILKNKQEISWQEPINLAQKIAYSSCGGNWCFLYSGLNDQIANSKSYIALFPQEEIVGDDFAVFEDNLKENCRYFGYFSYGLKNDLENLPQDEDFLINLPNLWLMNFAAILEFDHDSKKLIQFCAPNYEEKLSKIINSVLRANDFSVKIENLQSNFSKEEYLQKVKRVQEHIVDGDIYQANLTRKFFGKFTQKPQDDFDIFIELSKKSPANYSCFLKLDEYSVISSSPELFLKIDADGKVISSPIKGTAPRADDDFLDRKLKTELQNSPKEQAENLMIVDLVRNDLSRHCQAASVKVKGLFKASSYKTVHHLSSDICAVKNKNSSNLDIVKACFPPGSMTGAPKIKAMEICSELEKHKRGIYSGAIGFFDQNECHLNVVIRTLIIKGNVFEFQVGGAITFDSDPEAEWGETLNKAKGIVDCLGIQKKYLENL